MAQTRAQIILAVFMTLLYVHAQGFALRKRNVENKLNEALKVIERQKRHVSYDENDRDWPEPSQDFYDWDRVYPSQAERRFQDTFDLPALQDLYTGPYESDNSENEISMPRSFDWNSVFESDQPDAEEASARNSEPVSEEELQDIFEPSQGKAEKRSSSEDTILAKALSGKRNPEYDPSIKSEKRANGEEAQGLSKEQVEALLNGADMDFDGAMSGDADRTEASNDGSAVSDNEIQNMFKNVEDNEVSSKMMDDDGAEADNSNQMMFLDKGDIDSNQLEQGELPGQPINKELFMNELKPPGNAHTSIKRKRSNWNTYPRSFAEEGYDLIDGAEEENAIEDLARELAEAKADVKILKNFLALEEEENANLAKALNLATKSQTERSDKYVQEEIQYIKQAIQDEMDLEEIKDVLQIASSLKGPNVDDLSDDPDQEDDDADLPFLPSNQLVDKRGFPEVDEDEMNVDIPMETVDDDEIPVDDGDEEPPIDLSAEDLVNIMLASKLKEMLSQNTGNYMNNINDKNAGLESWYNTPVYPDAEVDAEEYYINPLMKELYEKLQGQDMAKRGDEFEEPTRSCPAVEELTDNCDFMKALGLSLDEEATDLCNRHQLCYTCGSALDLTPNDCDRGYLSESANLCDKEGGCDEDAAGLFIIMLKYHDYQPLSQVPDSCASSCAADYIARPSPTTKK